MEWRGPACEVLVDKAMNVHQVHSGPSRTIAWLLVTGPVRRVTARVVAAPPLASLFETVARVAESWVEWVGDFG